MSYERKLITTADGKLIEALIDPVPLAEEQVFFLPAGYVFWIRKTYGRYTYGVTKL
ncbi:MAG: hypothetical protein ACREB3_08030 [Burkholderiales bacterium]